MDAIRAGNDRSCQRIRFYGIIDWKSAVIARTMAMRNTVVNSVTGIASIGIGIFLASQFFFKFGEFFPWMFIISMGIIYLVFILTQAILMYVLVKKEAASWLPGKS